MQHLLSYLLHIDTYLASFIATYGNWTYILLFAIIFCETGLVVTPFLPGDSLLFAAGSLAANGDGLKIQLLLLLLILASTLGNKLNYLIGRFIGPRIFQAKNSVFLNKKHLEKTHAFYQKHGGKTIILARFLPIIRTFAPFVAGVGYMNIATFSLYNILSAILWIGGLVGLGYFLGTLPVVREHFAIVIYGIILISLLPPFITLIYQHFSSSNPSRAK